MAADWSRIYCEVIPTSDCKHLGRCRALVNVLAQQNVRAINSWTSFLLLAFWTYVLLCEQENFEFRFSLARATGGMSLVSPLDRWTIRHLAFQVKSCHGSDPCHISPSSQFCHIAFIVNADTHHC